jgi:hypothetical protein
MTDEQIIESWEEEPESKPRFIHEEDVMTIAKGDKVHVLGLWPNPLMTSDTGVVIDISGNFIPIVVEFPDKITSRFLPEELEVIEGEE